MRRRRQRRRYGQRDRKEQHHRPTDRNPGPPACRPHSDANPNIHDPGPLYEVVRVVDFLSSLTSAGLALSTPRVKMLPARSRSPARGPGVAGRMSGRRVAPPGATRIGQAVSAIVELNVLPATRTAKKPHRFPPRYAGSAQVGSPARGPPLGGRHGRERSSSDNRHRYVLLRGPPR